MSNELFKPGGLRAWAKRRETPLASLLYRIAIWWRYASLPHLRPLHGALYAVYTSLDSIVRNLARVLWITPLFQARLEQPAKHLYVFGGMPMVQGPVRITLGAGCRIGGSSNIMGRTSSVPAPRLIVGDNCDVGWGHSIAVGRLVRFGNNVRLASRVTLAGYPGHPVDARARARGEPDTEDQVGDIVLEDDVWLGQGVYVLGNVTIGRGTIVGAGSVVTGDLPPNVLAAGNPARVIRQLSENLDTERSTLNLADGHSVIDKSTLKKAS